MRLSEAQVQSPAPLAAHRCPPVSLSLLSRVTVCRNGLLGDLGAGRPWGALPATGTWAPRRQGWWGLAAPPRSTQPGLVGPGAAAVHRLVPRWHEAAGLGFPDPRTKPWTCPAPGEGQSPGKQLPSSTCNFWSRRRSRHPGVGMPGPEGGVSITPRHSPPGSRPGLPSVAERWASSSGVLNSLSGSFAGRDPPLPWAESPGACAPSPTGRQHLLCDTIGKPLD